MSRFKEWIPPKIEHGTLTKWNWMVQYPEGLKLGKYTDIGAFTYINAKYGVIIEDYVQIGSHCSIYSESTIDGKKGKVVIKRNARIGSHSVIMPGVTIGENSIIGAFSFVNKDIPDNVIAFGVPAKVFRKLTEEEIKKLMEEIEE
ncbi:acyltransferase [Thermococcus sp. M36]|uniref:acyltransferase n=1 Tax=Thermococcus sp. M36 TaxID=1638261 RepID=UPI00143AE4EF|nr:acyltransferase [Thermococcus sp. M36]NJE05559.1 acyltransferase [Thermococcus sp. M36]